MPTAAPAHPAPHPLTLYRWAVQDPEVQATVLRLMHERVHGLPGDPRTVDAAPSHPPTAFTLREDFAGTSAESVAWIALDPHARDPGLAQRRAIAIDLDRPTLDWAAARAARLLGPRADAIEFRAADATTIAPPEIPPADIIAALNFSILYLREQAVLEAYLCNAREGLVPGGILVLNLFGGVEATRPGITAHHVVPTPRMRAEPPASPFEYQWEVRSFDARTARLDCRIHFASPGTPRHGSGGPDAWDRRDAFSYDWRLWSPRELVDSLTRAGFSRAEVWRHTHDPARGHEGVSLGPVDPGALESQPSWTAYIVAQR